jgi:hypothetical protein
VSSEGVYIYRPRPRQDEFEEEEEEEQQHPFQVKDEWEEVSHNRYKGKRDMSVEEMDAMCDEMDDEDEDRGMNEHLFEVSHRHDHH